MELITTHTNHNHEELLEDIDVYRGSWGKLHTREEKLGRLFAGFRSCRYLCDVIKKHRRNGYLTYRV